MKKYQEQYPAEVKLCNEYFEKRKNRQVLEARKILKHLEQTEVFIENLNEFDTPISKALALVNEIYKWPSCISCGQKVKLFGLKFTQTCSKACAGKIAAPVRTQKQITKNTDTIKTMIGHLEKKGIYPDKTPTLISNEVVTWTHLDHTFSRPLYNGGWLTGCPKCNNAEQRSGLSAKRWEKWREENPGQKFQISEQTKLKIKETTLKKYGVENVGQVPAIRDKINDTFRKNYNSGAAADIVKNLSLLKNIEAVDAELFYAGEKYKWKHTECGAEFYHYFNYGGLPECPACKPKSMPENEVFGFISEIIYAERGRRDLLIPSKKEIDIWIPSLKIGIEMNGAYWHAGDKINTPLIEKTTLAVKNNIHLIHIWDYEWVTKKEIIKSIIKSRLGLNRKIFARNCTLREVSILEAKAFFNNNHIHGAVNRLTHNIALEHEGKIVMLVSFGKPRFSKSANLEIIRSCSAVGLNVIGGLGRCLKYMERTKGRLKIITYADRRFFDAASYQKLGFTFIANRAPNYVYAKGTKTLSRIECQKHKLPLILGERFNPDLTEEQNMYANHWSKISDCGVSSWAIELGV